MFLPEFVNEKEDGTLECTFWCLNCDKNHVVKKVPRNGYQRWLMNNEFVQNCFPEMDKDERELFISGICPKCWDEMYPAGNPSDTGEENEIEQAPNILPKSILLGDK